MTAWGRTGRVTLDGGDVEVDDVWIGYAKPGYAEAYSLKRGKTWTTSTALTLDAAVMWVLQHASPWSDDREHTKAIRDVWRAERPVVTKVIPMWPLSQFPLGRYGEIDTRPNCAPTRWGIAPKWPHRRGFATRDTWADAMHAAIKRSREDYARQVTP